MEIFNHAIKAAPLIALGLLFIVWAFVQLCKWATGELPEPGNDNDGTDTLYCERNPRAYNFKPQEPNA